MKRLLLYLFLFCFANAVFAQQEVTVDLQTAGTLANKLGENKDNITTLHVSGPLDEDDFNTLKSMNMLQVLDMGRFRIYLIQDGIKKTMNLESNINLYLILHLKTNEHFEKLFCLNL